MLRLHLLGPLELADDGSHDARAVLTQPKRLAVLAFLAAREAGEYVRRDTLLGAFWPELSQHAARRSLRQTLHFLRSHLGAAVLLARGDDEVAVDPAALQCDVARFLEDLRAGHAAEALDAYRGELLAGYFLSGGTAAFEHWLETERGRLRDLAAKAAAGLARDAAGSGDLRAAVAWERRALTIASDDETALRRLLLLLERSGEQAAALRAYDAFARRLSRELDHPPSPETDAIVARLRAAVPAPPTSDADADAAPLPEAAGTRAAGTPAAPTGRPATGRRLRAGVLAGALLVLAAGAAFLVGRPRHGPEVLAVGEVRDADSSNPDGATRILPDLLATNLTRIGGLAIVPPARIEEIAGQLAAAHRPAGTGDAATAAGATELVDGVVYRLGGDSLRLDLRLVGARNGVMRGALTLNGTDAFSLADSAAARFAGRFGLERPARSLVTVTSASPAAQTLYQAGLRAYYRDGDDAAAARLFNDALAADSTFAMAAYYLSEALGPLHPEPAREALARAYRMAGRATPREALLIRAAWGEERGETEWPATADSLAAHYPDDPQSRILAGEGHTISGDFPGAIADYRQAIHLDSLSLQGSDSRCAACDAYGALVGAYLAADSAPAALAAGRAWIGAQPASPRAWSAYSRALEWTGRRDSALAGWIRVNELQGRGDADLEVLRARLAARAGDVAAAESLLEASAADPRDPNHLEAEWWLLLTLRTAGRPGAALPLARRLVADTVGHTYNENALTALPLGEVLFEAGRLAEAARIFEAAGMHTPAFRASYPGAAERDRAWALAQRATVAAAERDSAALRWLADSVSAHGRRSPWDRDRRLASYVRGLRLEVTGQLAAAADTLRDAVSSPTVGFSRVNLELGRVLLALGRPAAALPWLQAALRGPLDVSNFYTTRTELEDLTGDAFAALGRRDSAVAHYAWVERAWRSAEPAFRARWVAAHDYVTAAGPAPETADARSASAGHPRR